MSGRGSPRAGRAAPAQSCTAAKRHRGSRTRTPAHGHGAKRPAWRVLHGDCLELLADLRAGSADAVVCDPPYGIDFQGKHWDGPAIRDSAAKTSRCGRLRPGEAFQHWTRCWAAECLRALRPGGHMLAFGSPRTFHRLAGGVEDAGFELRDTLMWLYASGMPKSRRLPGGRGTALKPAWEPILLARKPPDAPIERNLRRHRTGALNIDACRVQDRWPANVLLTHHQRCTTDRCAAGCALHMIDRADRRNPSCVTAPPSRLFFSSKVSRAERDTGCEQLPARELNLFPNSQHGGASPARARNPHPTIKPIDLMRWLIALSCPPGGLVLDPFCGSGSTGAAAVLERCRFVGIEQDAAYLRIARARIEHWASLASSDRRDGGR
jgi:site-specific DNA-methyltransferase (adenine-specific)